jgi:hypothetical protein
MSFELCLLVLEDSFDCLKFLSLCAYELIMMTFVSILGDFVGVIHSFENVYKFDLLLVLERIKS